MKKKKTKNVLKRYDNIHMLNYVNDTVVFYFPSDYPPTPFGIQLRFLFEGKDWVETGPLDKLP